MRGEVSLNEVMGLPPTYSRHLCHIEPSHLVTPSATCERAPHELSQRQLLELPYGNQERADIWQLNEPLSQ
jgi:hypothetical protein